MVEKVIRDGKVAVLVSYGYGAGWSTWADANQAETALFDRRFVEAAEAGVVDIEPLCKEIFGDDYFYTGGWPVSIEWVPQGAQFTVDEYDGAETLLFISDLSITA